MTAREYSRAVLDGSIIAGPHVRDACRRFESDLVDLPKAGFWYDDEEEQHIVDFFEEELVLLKGKYEGQPFKVLPVWRFVLGNLFGWKCRNSQGTVIRRFNDCYIETSKGTAKSMIGAGICLYMLACDGENRAEVYVIGRNAEQARVSFNMAVAMRDESPLLSEVTRKFGGHDPYKIEYRETESVMLRLADETRGQGGSGKSGPMPSCILGDEAHEWRSNDLYHSLRSGFKHREQPLGIVITNSGAGITENPCWEMHERSISVASGEREDNEHFSFVCSMDTYDDPWEDESCWVKACPTLPGIPGYEDIRREVREAQGQPSKRAWVDRVRFCRWTDAVDPWIGQDAWIACERPALSPYEDRKEQPCFIALDLASKIDLTAGAAVWLMNDGTLEAECIPWAPANAMPMLRKKLNKGIDKWVDDGHLNLVPGPVMDYAYVANWVRLMRERYNVRALAYDPRFIDEMVRAFEEEGVSVEKAPSCVVNDIGSGNLPILAHPQGTQGPSRKDGAIQICMHTSIEKLESAILRGQLNVRYNPVLRWGMLGVVCTPDQADNRRFLKKSSLSKIDTAVATCMAVGLARAWREPDVGFYLPDTFG